jgi:hypothetical protein
MVFGAAAALGTATASPTLAYDPQGKPADNSGRHLAIAIPGIGVAQSAVPVAITPGVHRAPTFIKTGAGHKSGDDDFSQNPTLSGFGTQLRLSRQAKQALDNGLKASEAISDEAWKRFADMAIWISMLLRQSDQPPRVTPVNGLITHPQVNVASMAPIADPGQGIHLVVTSERRLRTVVGR